MGIYQEEHNIFRSSFKKFIEKEIVPYIDEWEEQGGFPRELWKKFGAQGYLCPWADEKYGGSGVGFEYSAIIVEELGRVDACLSIAAHNEMMTPYFAEHGTEEQKEKWFTGCITGDLLLSVAMTEPNTGSDLQAIRTTAVTDGDDYIVNGQKTFITNGNAADLCIVVCKVDTEPSSNEGISLLVVESGTPGFEKGRRLNKIGLHMEDTSELLFEDCRVPKSNLLGEVGGAFSYLMSKLQRERLSTTLFVQALTERILEDAIEYSKTREAFGKPIGNFQHNSFKIAEMATEVELGRVFLDRLVEDFSAGIDIVTRVSMAKWWIGEMANRTAYNALQLYGSYGLMEEYPICRHYRDVRGYTLFAGTTEIMKLIISRKLGLKSD